MGTYIGISNTVGLGTNGAAIPGVVYDGNTKIFFDSTIGITKDGSNLVSAWNSRIGANHLLQATGTNQPLWSANGVRFDGVDNFMKCVAFTWNQPEFIYMVVKQVTWTSSVYLFDGNTVGTMGLVQCTGSPRLDLFAAGYAGIDNPDLALNTFGIIRSQFNIANSFIRINLNAAITGNPGGNNAGGFTLGAWGDGTARWAHIEVKEIIGRSSAVGEAAIYAYLKAKYSL